MNKCLFPLLAILLACIYTGDVTAQPNGQDQPIDQDPNPESSSELPFSDISVSLSKLGENYLRTGSFVKAQKMAKVQPGTSQQQVITYLGMPYLKGQYPGGEAWEYHINLPITENDVIVCQYQVAFTDEKVSNLAWRRPQCESLYEKVPKLPTEVFVTSADILFDFSSANLSEQGKERINEVANALLNNYAQPQISITAHSDRIGTEDYNQILSELRAHAIAHHLVAAGVPAGQIQIEGRGKSEPLVQCPGNKITAELKDCLAPNRRAQVEVIELQPDRDEGTTYSSSAVSSSN